MENYIGEIRIFAGDYAPQNWALCNGALLPISQNEALFTLLGTVYGGDGVQTFALPDLRGRIPLHKGTGPGLAPIVLGQKAGAETTVLTAANLPVHSHALVAVDALATTGNPTNMMMAKTSRNVYVTNVVTPPDTTLPPPVAMGPTAIASAGGSTPISLIQPYLAVNFIIATVGIFPSQN